MRPALIGIVLPIILTAGNRVTAPPQAYEVDRDASRLWVVTHKAGLFSFLGHEHALVPGEWSAELCLASPVPAGAHGSIVIRTASLVIDSDSARALAGLGGGPSPAAVADIQSRIFDASHLDSARFAEIRVDATASHDESGGRVAARGEVSLHGVTRPVELEFDVDTAGSGALRLAGTLPIRQRDFGIEPESRAGVVKVADELDLHVRIVARPSGRPCTLAPPGR